MLRIDQPRVFPRALGLALVLSMLAVTGAANAAEPSTRLASLRGHDAPLANAIATPPVRFFTIDSVLAKHDGLRGKATGAVEFAMTERTSQPGSVDDAAATPKIAAVSDEPFGLMTFRAPGGVLWSKWSGVETAMTAEAAAIRNCQRDDDRCSPSERRFVGLVRAAARERGSRARAELANRSVNEAVRYVSDQQQHGVADLWSTPLQTLRNGRGDCEDYAIAKYALLIAAGVAENDLRLVLVRDLAVREDHAVLAIRSEGRWLALDNRHTALLEGDDLQSFMPLFAIDRRGVSLFAAPYAERPRHESETDIAPAADASAGGSMATLPLQL